MSAICIDVKSDKAPHRALFAQRGGGLLVDSGFLGAAERGTCFHSDQDRFVRGEQRLRDHRHDGHGNKQKHRQPSRKKEPKECAVFHYLCLLCGHHGKMVGNLMPPTLGFVIESLFLWRLRYRPLRRLSTLVLRFRRLS